MMNQPKEDHLKVSLQEEPRTDLQQLNEDQEEQEGFRSSSMRCSGACRYGTHGVSHGEERRRPSPTRIPYM